MSLQFNNISVTVKLCKTSYVKFGHNCVFWLSVYNSRVYLRCHIHLVIVDTPGVHLVTYLGVTETSLVVRCSRLHRSGSMHT